MNTQKDLGIERCFQTRHRLSEQMRLAARTDANIVFLSADPANIFNRQEEDASTRLEHDASLVCTGASVRGTSIRILIRIRNSRPNPLNRGAKTILCKRLEQIIDCVVLERAHGILVISSSE